MSKVNLSSSLMGAGNTDVVEFSGGVIPGVRADDPLGTTPMSFTVTNLGSTAYSLTAQSYLANTATVAQVAPVLGNLLKELIRKRIIEGDVTE